MLGQNQKTINEKIKLSGVGLNNGINSNPESLIFNRNIPKGHQIYSSNKIFDFK